MASSQGSQLPNISNDECSYPDTKCWGTEHPRPRTSPKKFQWVHLGHGTKLRDSQEWVSAERSSFSEHFWAWAFDFTTFLASIGCTEAETVSKAYRLKIPGKPEAVEVTDRISWYWALEDLVEHLSDAGKFCQSLCPVILVCTAEQAERCEAHDWIDPVRLKAERARILAESAKGLDEKDQQEDEVPETL